MHPFCERIRRVRREIFGEHGVPVLAVAMGISSRDWLRYEAGADMPAPVVLRFIDLLGVQPLWLLDGRGQCYRDEPGPPPASAYAGPPRRWRDLWETGGPRAAGIG